MFSNPEPTTRAVVDVGRKCNINCKMCYYSHLGDLRKQSFKSCEELKEVIKKAEYRGNDYLDFTGGEPTIHPDICELVKYAKDEFDMGSCIITNALIGENATSKIIDAGVDDFLLSIHGTPAMQDEITGYTGAREKQLRFLQQIRLSGVQYRFNCVLTKYNQDCLEELTDFFIIEQPRIVNYINMNPHGDWSSDISGTQAVIADLRKLEPELNKSIERLEAEGIGVNVRYYPMCRIAPEYRRCVCNDLHVTFDPYEWDYDIHPKQFYTFRKWGINTSSCMEWKAKPCTDCNLSHICGGINKAFNIATQGKMIEPIHEQLEDDFDFYMYRGRNELTLKKRGRVK